MAPQDPNHGALERLERLLLERLDHVEQALSRQRDELADRLKAVEARLKGLEVESQLTVVAVTRLEERIESGLGDQARMRLDLNQVRAKVGDLESRIRGIEARRPPGRG